MNLLLVRPGEPAVPARELEARGADHLVAPADQILPRPAHARTLVLVDAASSELAHACRNAAGEPVAAAPGYLACPHHAGAEAALDERVQAAARLAVDGVMLDRLDAFVLAGPRGAGFCAACGVRLEERLSRRLGEQYVPSGALAKLATDEKAPFFGDLRVQRWHAEVEPGARLVRRVRDEVRRVRGTETLVGARFSALSPAAVALGRHLDLALVPAPTPAPDRSRVSTYEVLGAALVRRDVVGLLDDAAAAKAGIVVQAARLARAVGAEVVLPAGAPDESHRALARHRAFWKGFRSQYRPPERMAELLVLYSPACDHATGGRHGGGVRAVAEALTQLGAQYRIVLALPREGTEPVVVADAGALPEALATKLERRVTEGASAICVGVVGAMDEDGRALEPFFRPFSAGLNREGTGTVFSIDPLGAAEGAAERRWEPLTAALDKALESLLGRGRRAASYRGAELVVKLYLDPDRRLDVHVVSRTFDAAKPAGGLVQGAVLHLSGGAVSGARSGALFSEDGQERKVALTPFGMGVQALLPDFSGGAVLTIAR